MKKLTGTIIILLIAFSGAFAQAKKGDAPEMFERMKMEKISFLTAQLDLTAEEAQAFWPVYNEFEKKRFELEKANRGPNMKGKDGSENLSESDLKKMNEEYINSFSEEAKLMQEYNKKFLDVLPIQKVMKLYQAERKFRSHMLQEFRNRGPKDQRPDGQGAPDGQNGPDNMGPDNDEPMK